MTEKAAKRKPVNKAMVVLQILQHADGEPAENAEEAVQALMLLRGRDAWAREKDQSV